MLDIRMRNVVAYSQKVELDIFKEANSQTEYSHGIAEKIYMFVSRNRLFFSRIFGCKGACAIMPERQRDGD